MNLLILVGQILLTGIVLKICEKEITKISKAIREKPFETFMIVATIILLINSIVDISVFKF